MSMKNKHELQKTIDIAKEFISRAELRIGEINALEGKYLQPSITSASVRRQSMELTRQLAILRRS